jgi:hypothetical protein
MAGALSRGASPVAIARAGAALVLQRGGVAVLLAWGVVAGLTALAVAPAWAWWTRVLGHSIEAATLLGHPNTALIGEVSLEDPSAVRMIVTAAALAAVVAVLLNPFIAGGMLGALRRGPGERAGASFAAGGSRHYGAMLRAMPIVWPIPAILAVGLSVVPLVIIFGIGPSGVGGVLSIALLVGIPAVCLTLGTALLDVVRVQIVRRDVGALRAVASLSRIGPTGILRLLGASLVYAALLALALTLLFAIRGWLAGDTWPSILAGLAVQQAHALGRTWLRGAWLASALAYADAVDVALPPPMPVASVAPVAEERPEMLVVVEREPGEGGMRGDERRGGEDLAAEVAGGLPAEGDAGRRDGEAGEAGPAGAAAGARDRGGAQLPPLA